MFKLDYFFHYKYCCRFKILNKFFNIEMNSLNILNLNNISIYFFVKNLDDLNHLCTSNYFYFIKYFFGKRAYISKYSYKFNLGTNYHNFYVQVFLKKYDIFFFFSFLSNDVLAFCNKQYIFFKFLKKNIYLILKDMTFFVEKKNNLGFFNLKDNLNIKLSFQGVDVKYLKKNLISFFKLLK